jgi:multidrug efflux pump subunit AcrA (membrane-fusion protein)
MDSNPLLAALQNNYGDGSPPPPDPNTVKGLLAFCKLWLEGDVEAGDLNNPCMSMAGRLKGGAKDTEDDLNQNPDLVDSARAPIERTAEAYWTIAEVLDRLPTLAAENDMAAFKEAISLFEEERQAVLDCNAEIERSLSGEVRLCPRCGDQGDDDVCESCDLVRLYPDPRATEYDRSKTAILAPIYGTVNEAYDSVMSGTASLHTVIAAVADLEQQLLELQKGYEQAAALDPEEGEDSSEFAEGKELANRLLDELERSFDGIDRIRDVKQNFQMSDLSRGWDTIFDAAVDIQRLTQRFAKAHGYEESVIAESDSIDIGGG